MTAPEKRRDRRHAMQQQAVITHGKKLIPAQLQNISFRGMFLTTDQDPPPLRQLIRVELQVPDSGATLMRHAMVVRRADSADQPLGVGVEIFGGDSGEWDQLVAFAAQRESMPPPNAAPLSVDQDRRENKRFSVALEMRVRTSRNIHVAWSHDMSIGGIMMSGDDLAVAQGDQVIINVVHPESRASLRLDGTVRRAIEVNGRKAAAVEFSPLDDNRRNTLLDFLMTAMAVIEERAKS